MEPGSTIQLNVLFKNEHNYSETENCNCFSYICLIFFFPFSFSLLLTELTLLSAKQEKKQH